MGEQQRTTGEDAQRWDPKRYARDAGFVATLGAPLIEWLAPIDGERVLDLGCGDGALTEKLLRHGCLVVGVDASAEQVEAARARGLDARVMDGEALRFTRAFEAVFSNATLHWLKRPELAIAGVARALVPGGRFVGEFGGAGCVATIRGALRAGLTRRGIAPDAYDPWYFPTSADYCARLESGGFAVERCELFARPTPLPTDVSAWLELFAQRFTHALPQAERSEYLNEVRAELVPALEQPDGSWIADYVRLRFVARLTR